MPKLTATDPVVAFVNSHYITLERDKGSWVFGKEECYPRVDLIWRKTRIRVEFNAVRHTQDQTWHLYATRAYTVPKEGEYRGDDVTMTDTFRAAVNEAGPPVILRWLDSPAYTESRQQTIVHALRRMLQDSRYDVDLPQVADALSHFGNEVRDGDFRTLNDALDAKSRYFELIDSVPAE